MDTWVSVMLWVGMRMDWRINGRIGGLTVKERGRPALSGNNFVKYLELLSIKSWKSTDLRSILRSHRRIRIDGLD